MSVFLMLDWVANYLVFRGLLGLSVYALYGSRIIHWSSNTKHKYVCQVCKVGLVDFTELYYTRYAGNPPPPPRQQEGKGEFMSRLF